MEQLKKQILSNFAQFTPDLKKQKENTIVH